MQGLRTWIFLLIAAALTGCAAERIVSPAEILEPVPNARGDELRHLTVAVEPNPAANYGDANEDLVVRELNQANLFGSVILLEDAVETPDLIFSNYEKIPSNSYQSPMDVKGFNCFEPYLLVVSIGIIPSICENDYTLSFSIQSAHGDELKFQDEITTKTIVAWVAFPLALSPEWKIFTAVDLHLRKSILSRAPEIIALTKK